MKDLKIYSVDEVQEPLILKLVHSGHGGVALEAVDLDGDPISEGSLLSITSNGFLQLNGRISEELQLPLDNKGRLKLVDYEEKVPVTFSDDELRSISDMRDWLIVENSKVDALPDVDAYFIVLDKMIEALGLPIANT